MLNPWLIGLSLLLLAMLLFLLVGIPAELVNKTYEENEPTIRRWLHLPPKRPRTQHPIRPPIAVAFVIGSAVLMALAEPSPIFSREMLVTILALIVAVPATVLTYSYAIERHARRTAITSIVGRLWPVYPALVVAVLCALLSRMLHIVPGYTYGLIIAYTPVAARVVSRQQEGVSVLKATAALLVTAMLSWISWQLWFADPASDPSGFVMRWLDTTLSYFALLGLGAPLLALLPLRFADGRSLWRWSKPVWLTAYCLCLAAYLIVLMDFGADGSATSTLITIAILIIGFGVLSFSFWGFFTIRARRLALRNRTLHRAGADSAPDRPLSDPS